MGNDLKIPFDREDWVKENRLCAVHTLVDMSFNYCITAPRDWVENNCPELLTKYRQSLRFPDEDGLVFGQFDDEFLEYREENIGIDWRIL